MDTPHQKEPTVAVLRGLLTAARINGRSAAVTRADLMALCAKHALFPASTTAFPDMPFDVMELVLRSVVDSSVASLQQRHAKRCNKVREEAEALTTTMLALARTSRGLRAMLPDASPQWTDVLRVFAECDALHCREATVALHRAVHGRTTPRRALCLVALTGCELCGASRIRKVHWTFDVRCCRACLEKNTISDYRLRSELGASDGLLASMPHTVVDMYRPGTGSFSTRFYWTASALRELGHPVGATLDDARSEAKAKRMRGLFDAFVGSNSSLAKRARAIAPSAFVSAEALHAASATFAWACRGAVVKQPNPPKVAREAVESFVTSDVRTWIAELMTMTSHSMPMDDVVRRCTKTVADASLRGRALKPRGWFETEVWPIEVAAAEEAAAAEEKAAA